MMHQVALVCSFHSEIGQCNAGELLRILRALAPDVIFVEGRPAETEFPRNLGILEASAIAQYRGSHRVQVVPVDRYEMPKDLLS